VGYIDGEQLRHKYPQGHKILPCVLEQVKNALDLLHECRFVLPNILVASVEGQDRVQLVDFD